MPFFIPSPKVVASLSLRHPVSLEQHCANLGLRCRGSGAWTKRMIEVRYKTELEIQVEPGDWGSVLIMAPTKAAADRSQLALYILAYGLHDLVAKESIRHTSIAEISPPVGRPRISRALSTKERQRRFRARQRRV